ncbi:hypothetical protein QOT17_005155 [Balamuthia mandrillaris]
MDGVADKFRDCFSNCSCRRSEGILGDKTWRCEKYGPLGWAESLLRAMAIGVALASISIYDASYREYGPEKKAQQAFLGIIASIQVIWLLQRVVEREIFGIVLNSFHMVVHWVLFMVLFRSEDPGAFVFTFCFLNIMAEYVRMMFLFVMNEYDVIWLPKLLLYFLSFCLALFYLVILILQCVIYLVTFET